MTAIRLRQLLHNIPSIEVKGNKDVEILSIANHSHAVGPGSLFIAKRGRVFDANAFVPEAVRAGAVCIVSDTYDPSLKSVTQVITKDVPHLEALLAHAFWSKPSEAFPVLGITGTSGKTTTSYLLRHMFQTLGYPCGLIGSIEYSVGPMHYEAKRTTPDLLTVVKLLAKMRQSQMKACAMEVTSHACVQGRVEGIRFQGGIFTNLTHEHLDYHLTMEQYASAKKLFFEQIQKEGIHVMADPFAVINQDDPFGSFMREGFTHPVFTYSMKDPKADFFAKNIQFHADGMSFVMVSYGKEYTVKTPLVGLFNVMNILAATGAFYALGIDVEKALHGASTFTGAPGRLEKVPNDLGITVVVDFSHKEDALRKVLTALREGTSGRIVTLFGCGGDRDRAKRPLMAKAAESLSDVVVVTHDNPRTEDPKRIIQEICAGFQTNKYIVIEDRQAAIGYAIQQAKEGDVVLLAGKGHEKEQIFSHGSVPFDDKEIASLACKELKKKQSEVMS